MLTLARAHIPGTKFMMHANKFRFRLCAEIRKIARKPKWQFFFSSSLLFSVMSAHAHTWALFKNGTSKKWIKTQDKANAAITIALWLSIKFDANLNNTNQNHYCLDHLSHLSQGQSKIAPTNEWPPNDIDACASTLLTMWVCSFGHFQQTNYHIRP